MTCAIPLYGVYYESFLIWTTQYAILLYVLIAFDAHICMIQSLLHKEFGNNSGYFEDKGFEIN